jgi:hypothetical protein
MHVSCAAVQLKCALTSLSHTLDGPVFVRAIGMPRRLTGELASCRSATTQLSSRHCVLLIDLIGNHCDNGTLHPTHDGRHYAAGLEESSQVGDGRQEGRGVWPPLDLRVRRITAVTVLRSREKLVKV